MNNRIKACAVAVLVLASALSATYFLVYREAERQETSSRRARMAEVHALQANLQNNLDSQMALFNILRTAVAAKPDLNQEEFEEIINRLSPRPAGVFVLTLARNGVISATYPGADRKELIGQNLLERPKLARYVQLVMEGHTPILAGPVIFGDGKKSLAYLSDIYVQDAQNNAQSWGLGLLLIDLEKLTDNIDLDLWPKDMIAVRLHQPSKASSDSEFLYGDEKIFSLPDTVRTELKESGSTWEIVARVMPNPAGERVLAAIWGVGGLISVILAVLIYRMLVELSERRWAQIALQKSEDRLEGVLQATSDWMWEVDQEFRFTYLSGRVTEITGLQPDSVFGHTRMELTNDPEMRKPLLELNDIMSRRQPFRDFLYRLDGAAHGGGTAYLRSSGAPVYDETGWFVGYRGTTTDVTAEVEAQERAVLAERRLRDAVESMIEGLALFDPDGSLQIFNARFTDLLEENNVHEKLSLHDILAAVIDQNIREGEKAFKRIADGKSIPARLEFPARSGRWIYFSNQKTQDGSLVTVWVDISVRKKHEEERTILENELRQSQKLEAIGTLAGGIAHEINTPTQYITGNLQFIGDSFKDIVRIIDAAQSVVETTQDNESVQAALRPLSDVLRESDAAYLKEEIPMALQQSLEGTSQVARIVMAMKEFSHPVNAEHGPADLNRAIENTVAVCRNEWKHAAELTMDLDPDLPLVNCHLGEINQVLLNLIVNAAHAVESAQRGIGQIHITSRRDGEWVDIKISDTGTGIPESILYKIFDLFFTTKKVGKGTGQGLPIARDIIWRRHGGNILVDSTEGVGTTFTVRLPIAGRSKDAEREGKLSEGTESLS